MEALVYEFGAWLESVGVWVYFLAPLAMALVAILRVPGMPCVWSESLKRTEVAPNRIAEGKGARREAESEGSRRRTTALTNRNRIEGP